MKLETAGNGGPYNQIGLEFVPRTKYDLSSIVFRESSDVIAKDQLDPPRFELLVNESPELIRELVVQQQIPSMDDRHFLVLHAMVSFPRMEEWKVEPTG